MNTSYFWFSFPEYLSEDWYMLHRHLTGGPLFAAAVMNRIRAHNWHTAYARCGDRHFAKSFL